MTLGQRIGIQTFREYVKSFGYMERTGIDLPGESYSIFSSEMTELDLAIYAFGQNFNVTPIQHITAISSVANGGNLVTPYMVEKITDTVEGNVIFSHETEIKRQTVSEDICKQISTILEEGVSGDGGAKNAYVAGYRVAAKTGTSEKKGEGEEGLYICSTVAYAPADDPEVAIIIIVDEPTEGVLYGSTVAAPYVAGALENILPQLGVVAKYTDAELKKLSVTVGSYRTWSVTKAEEDIEKKGLKCEIVGDGDTVVTQLPAAGAKIEKSSGKIYLYTDKSLMQETVTVPDFTGNIASTANARIIGLGLNIKIEGTQNYMSGKEAVVYKQSIPPGTKVAKGEVITLTFRYMDADEEPDYRG